MTAFNSTLTKPTSLKRNPFNQTSARFIGTDYKARSAPGPGQYRIPGFADENLRKALVDGGKKPPFNIASVRRLTMTKKEEFNTPGRIDQRRVRSRSSAEFRTQQLRREKAGLQVEARTSHSEFHVEYRARSCRGRYSGPDRVRRSTCLSRLNFPTETPTPFEKCPQTAYTISQCCQTNVCG